MTMQKGKPAIHKSKKAELERLVGRRRGASLEQLEKTLGWQPHSIRAAISRLRTDGIDVVLDRTGKTPVYRSEAAT